MKANNCNCYYWQLAIIVIFAAGILVQANMMLNFDVSWLLVAANKLLHGGHYYTDFIETNPPMILYLYLPAIFFAKFFHLSFAIAFKIYTFVLALFSLCICNYLLRKIFNDTLRYALLAALVFCYVLMPGYSFGEREHFAIMLTLPYLFLLDLRMAKTTINIFLPILIGFMAAIGFAIKPYFLLALIFCELFLIYKRHNLFSWFRIETLIIGLVILGYILSLFYLTPNYIFKVLPLVYNLYFIAAHEPFGALVAQSGFVFWLIALGVYVSLFEKLAHKNLATILLLASVGYLAAYFIQHTTWYYHLLPVLVISTLLMLLFIGEKLLSIVRFNLLNIILLVLLQLSILIFPVVDAVRHITTGILTAQHMRTNRLFQFVKDNANQQKIFVFTVKIPVVFGLVDYAGAISASRFPSQLFLPGLVWLQQQPDLTAAEKSKLQQQKREIINIVIADLQQNQPKIILIDNNKKNLYPNKQKFDYLKFFSQNAYFRELLKSYRYCNTIDHFAIYINRASRCEPTSRRVIPDPVS